VVFYYEIKKKIILLFSFLIAISGGITSYLIFRYFELSIAKKNQRIRSNDVPKRKSDSITSYAPDQKRFGKSQIHYHHLCNRYCRRGNMGGIFCLVKDHATAKQPAKVY
jgi:phosphate/sulfate permease